MACFTFRLFVKQATAIVHVLLATTTRQAANRVLHVLLAPSFLLLVKLYASLAPWVQLLLLLSSLLHVQLVIGITTTWRFLLV